MQGQPPKETFPLIGTVHNPAFFYDGTDLLLSYEVAPADGGGIAILKFSKVIEFSKMPVTVEGLPEANYPTKPWDFTEIFGSERTSRWNMLGARFWTISFNDLTIEVVFTQVTKIHQIKYNGWPAEALAAKLKPQASF